MVVRHSLQLSAFSDQPSAKSRYPEEVK